MKQLASWLDDALFYEIYPQSYLDTNSDGIGDLNGVISKLDYIKDIGFNAIWLNPCFDSPFCDAGYDVRDYKKIAERYGTMEDMQRLIDEMHSRGMHLFLDLVAGHTSEEHEWFKISKSSDSNEYSDRYIWAGEEDTFKNAGIGGMAKNTQGRKGKYHYNFFTVQPSLNFGFAEVTAPWQTPAGSPAAKKTTEAIKDIIRFWCSKGVDGFRVDMAYSLVKAEKEGRAGTIAVWQDIFAMMDEEFPECAMVSEWGNASESAQAGFPMDFYMQMNSLGFGDMFDYGDPEDVDGTPFFSEKGEGNAAVFAKDIARLLKENGGRGYLSFITGNHDIHRRPRCLPEAQFKLTYGFIYTMPGVPFMYYGDEIGMREVLELDPVEGSMYRTGARTPMQWDSTENAGFSGADADDLYIPMDDDKNRPTVAQQLADENSILSFVKSIIAFRKANPALKASAQTEFLYAEEDEYPLVYKRFCDSQTLVVAVNPADRAVSADISRELRLKPVFVFGGGAQVNASKIEMQPQSFAIFEEIR